jgi:hypothetical protein
MISKAKITYDEIRDALMRSGYLLEVRVESQLQKQGYCAEANSAYTDPDTGKSRELDISAIGGRKIGPEAFDWMFPILLVECVNNPQPMAFFTKVPIVGTLYSEQVRYSGLPIKIRECIKKNAWIGLGEYLGVEKFHHYFKGRVATQFCSFSQKRDKGDWMASHENSHFSAFATLCQAIEHAIDDHYRSWRPGWKEWINIQVYYPILVVQGELLDIKQKGTGVTIREATHVAFRRTVVKNHEETTYQIDVIRERYLSLLLRVIDDEIARMCRLLRRRHKEVRRSVDYITRRIRRLRSTSKIREELEF